jgi:hypothetical protein
MGDCREGCVKYDGVINVPLVVGWQWLGGSVWYH